LEVHPITGRTHQIRLHLAFLECPVVGDTIYGKRHPSIKLKRHFLHASELRIHLRDQDEPQVFKAPMPDELIQVLRSLRDRPVH
jgi:23S rRNA pseudouridine1911/1915/1917 synthase